MKSTNLGVLFGKQSRGSTHESSSKVPASLIPRVAHHHVNIANVDEFVLSFTLPRKFVPEAIQVIPAGAPDMASSKQETVFKKQSFSKTKVDIDGLMARISVKKIHVAERNDSCRVYVNCVRISPEDKAGFNFWGGPYEKFIRKCLTKTWKAALKEADGGKNARLELNYATGDKPETQIHFTIKH